MLLSVLCSTNELFMNTEDRRRSDKHIIDSAIFIFEFIQWTLSNWPSSLGPIKAGFPMGGGEPLEYPPTPLKNPV